MSTYVLMRVLESAPRRYDAGIRMLTLGAVGRAYDRMIERVSPGQRVLDLGCGTGALTLRAARHGAVVRGIDLSAEMLALARSRVTDEHLEQRVELAEEGVAELDAEPTAGYDVVTAGLCLSELSTDELDYTLTQVRRVLEPDGLLLVADEVVPRRWPTRLLHWLVRLPLVAITYVLTQQTTHAVRDLDRRLAAAGFEVLDEQRNALDSFGCYVATNAAPAPTGREREGRKAGESS